MKAGAVSECKHRCTWGDQTRLPVSLGDTASLYDFCDSTRYLLNAEDHSGEYTGRRRVELLLFWSPYIVNTVDVTCPHECTPGVE